MDSIDKLRVRRAIELIGLLPVLQKIQTITLKPMGGAAAASAATASAPATDTEAHFLAAMASAITTLSGQAQQMAQQGTLPAQPLTAIQNWTMSAMALVMQRQQAITAQSQAVQVAAPASVLGHR